MKKPSFLLIAFLLPIFIHAQDSEMKNWTLNAYVKDLNSTWIQDFDQDWINWNTIHNRLDFKWYSGDHIIVGMGVRNQFIYGQFIQLVQNLDPDYIQQLGEDKGFLDLSQIYSSNNNYVLFADIDRAYFHYMKGKFDARIGRQRVNWGIGLVWNPNDIFNSFSYFDVDYEERPGSDAVRFQYYPKHTSSIQAVAKIDHHDSLTIAALYRFNKWNYDIQFMGGIMKSDLVIGSGWAGQIEGAGFRGEASWFIRKKELNKNRGILVASIEVDYTFRSSLYMHSAFLYNSNGRDDKAGWGTFFINQDISAKTFTLARFSIFGQVSYPLTPLLNTGVSAIYNPDDMSLYTGPGMDYSVEDNFNIMLMAQAFFGEKGTEFGDYGQIYYLQFKYSF